MATGSNSPSKLESRETGKDEQIQGNKRDKIKSVDAMVEATPMPNIPMAETLDWHAKRDPDCLAVVCGQDVVTRLELEKASNQAARVFAEMGVRPGDLVAIALPNGVAFYVSTFGALKLGATPMPVSHRLPQRERDSIIALAEPALVVGVTAAECTHPLILPRDWLPPSSVDDSPL